MNYCNNQTVLANKQTNMNQSMSEVISDVFDKYKKQIIELSVRPSETERIIGEMYIKMQEALSTQYYNNVFRFVSSVDIDEIICSSPPPTNIIDNNSENLCTPQKKKGVIQ